MTSYLIDFHILEYHSRGETTKVSHLKIMVRDDMVDLRTKVQEEIEVNSQQLHKFIEMNLDPSASERASTEVCG